MDDKDRQIARAVALKAAVELSTARNGNTGILQDAEAYEAWLLRPQSEADVRQPTPLHPKEAPYGEPPPHPGPSSGPPAAHICGRGRDDTEGCGAEMEHFSGRNTEGVGYAGYRCPEQKKTVDPAEQAAERVRHPVQWL